MGRIRAPIILLLVIPLLGGCALEVSSPSCAVRTHAINRLGALLWLRLTELSGGTVADSSASGFTGTVSASGISLGVPGPQLGGLAAQSIGVVGGGITAIGTTTSFEFIHSTLKFTLLFWAKPIDITDAAVTSVVGTANGTASNRGFFVAWNGAIKNYYLCLNDLGTGACFFGTANVATANDWHHFAITMDGSIVRYYVNGAIHDTFPPTSFVAAAGASTSPLLVGKLPGVTGSELKAGLDDIAMFNKTLTATEIAEVYAKSLECP